MNSSSANQHYVLWVKSCCPWCKKAEELLKEKSLPYHVFVMDKNLEELGRVKEKHNWDTVPLVFEVTSRGSFNLVGGYTDLEKYLGGLDESNSVQTHTNEKDDSSPD
jgi:glutaredoxin